MDRERQLPRVWRVRGSTPAVVSRLPRCGAGVPAPSGDLLEVLHGAVARPEEPPGQDCDPLLAGDALASGTTAVPGVHEADRTR